MKLGHSSLFRLLFVFFILLFSPNGLAELTKLPTVPAAYWAQGGTNLVQTEPVDIPFIERQELYQLLKEKNRVVFLDIREPNEYEQTHLPKALNISFIHRNALYDQLKTNSDQIVIPYCNWDFRGYIAATDLMRRGVPNVKLMYPHGLRGWMASGLPVAGKEVGKTDEKAYSLLMKELSKRGQVSEPVESVPFLQTKKTEGQDIHISMRIFPKGIEPDHVQASVGDRLTIDFIGEGEEHWFVIPDFGVDFHLKEGEQKTVTLNLMRAGYFPFGCISCCVRYQCKLKQAILVNVKEPLSVYGE